MSNLFRLSWIGAVLAGAIAAVVVFYPRTQRSLGEGGAAAEAAFEPAVTNSVVASISQEGISVELSISLLDHEAALSRPNEMREGDDVSFRFKITDTATGAALTNVYPAAWMVTRPEHEVTTQQMALRKAQSLINGTLFAPAELDVNVYYVLTLNANGTITVVDPRFGFGGTKLLALIQLESPGHDWALTPSESRLVVSLPESNHVAIIRTATWEVEQYLYAGPSPKRLAFQPDGHYLWVASGTTDPQTGGSGVTVVTADGLEVVARIHTGAGDHQIAFSDDSQFAFVTNSAAGTVSIIDVASLEKISDLETGADPVSISYSTQAQMAYVTHTKGGVAAVDARRQRVAARVKTAPGLGQIKFAPGGRLGFIVNSQTDVVHILDAATSRIVQTADVHREPDQLAFSDELAYVRHRGSATVLMIPFKQVGREGQPVPVVEFPGGDSPPGNSMPPCPADAIVPAPGANAVLVANPSDKSVYFYKEGMAAPMGTFSNYNRQPLAVAVVDRSLRERSAPGAYETVAKLRKPAHYDLLFFLDAPRIVHCFPVQVHADPALEQARNKGKVDIEPLIAGRNIRVDQTVPLRFKIIDRNSKHPRNGLADVGVLVYLAPGIWQKRTPAKQEGEGVYTVDFTPPQPGVYYAYVGCPSLDLTFDNEQFVVLHATADE